MIFDWIAFSSLLPVKAVARQIMVTLTSEGRFEFQVLKVGILNLEITFGVLFLLFTFYGLNNRSCFFSLSLKK